MVKLNELQEDLCFRLLNGESFSEIKVVSPMGSFTHKNFVPYPLDSFKRRDQSDGENYIVGGTSDGVKSGVGIYIHHVISFTE